MCTLRAQAILKEWERDRLKTEAHAASVPRGTAQRHLGNDIPVLSMNLCDGSQLSQTGEDLVQLKEKGPGVTFTSHWCFQQLRARVNH